MLISFIINSGKKIQDYSKPQKISLRIRDGRNFDFKKSTAFSVLVSPDNKKSNWDDSKQRVKNKSSIINRVKINRHLDNLESYFKKFYDNNSEKGIRPSKDDVKTHYDAFFDDRRKVKKEHDFIEYIEQYIERPSVKRLSKGTLKNYKKHYNTLKNQLPKKFYPLTFDKITMNWYDDFIYWFIEEKGYSTNYTGDIIKHVKLFLRNAFEDKLTTNDIFRNKKFKTIREDADDTYLDKEELKKIYDLNLENHKGLEVVRDLFLIGCFTGLRVSDWESVNSKNIIEKDGFKYLEIMIKKTKRIAQIPVYQDCLNILKKYDFKPPKRSAPYISREIKKVCKKAGINQVIELSKPGGEKRKLVRGEKYQFISSHTARRTLCTLLHKEGVPSIDIMQISGHKTESSFLKYIKVTRSETAERLAKLDLFKTNTLKAV